MNDICEAARVSTRTFFNYFESKEAALFAWDQRLTDELASNLAARPSHEPPLTALRRAMDDTMPSFAAQTGWSARKELFGASPELREKIVNALFRLEARLADILTDRIGCPPGSLYPQVLAGAMARSSAWPSSNGNRTRGSMACGRSSTRRSTTSPPASPSPPPDRRVRPITAPGREPARMGGPSPGR